MTTEEAIETLKTWRVTGDQAHEALGMAIKALEKQIPMKPLEKEYSNDLGENIHVYVIPCGKCGHAISFLYSYCPWCGQAIDLEGGGMET